MNAQQSKANAYQSTATYTGVAFGSPHSLITQMFEGAVKKIAQAKGAIDRDDIGLKAQMISDSIAIIASLDGCLDHDKGGEISYNLSSLYEYMNLRLAEANINNDQDKLSEVIKLILEIKSAWVQIAPGTNEAG